jgi:hypothetical protein
LSRFRIPPRIAPSPAAAEPGQQNAVARLRSSREAQSRLLAEQRCKSVIGDSGPEYPDQPTSAILAEGERSREKSRDEPDRPVSTGSLARPVAEDIKIKLVVLFRLPLALEPDVSAIASRAEVTVDYVLRALAREARATLRALTGEADLAPLGEGFTPVERGTAGIKVIGDPLTVYVRPDALTAMHHFAGDPWQVIPRATVVGVYFTAIVSRLVEARREA